ncbi:MAG: hypothetical protein IT165_30915 [Bryobacterales bacterium]|nr:hypothetical protein [Bryobacterales bacterium]
MAFPNRPSLREGAALSLLLAVHAAVLFHLARRTGVTIDEPSHIVSSILYWEGNDRLLPRDMPPLLKIAGGWAAASAGFRIVEESHPVWKTNHEWNIGLDMIRRMSERGIRTAMFRARLPLLLFPLATLVLLWWWGRQIHSPLAGLAIAFLFFAEPTALGHGALFKNDHAATFTYLLFWLTAWRFWKTPTPSTAAAMACGAALAILSKLSMLIVLPLAVLIVLLRSRKSLYLAFAVLIPYTAAIAACQFQTRLWGGFLPLPALMWDGVQSLLFNSRAENAVYLLGRHYPSGNPFYFAIAAAVKSPEPILLLLIAGACILAIRLKRRLLRAEDLFWILPGFLYFVLASLSPLQLGFRLVLPALPFALLICGAALQRLSSHKWTLAALLPALAVPLAAYYPNYLSYFNLASGGPAGGLRYLSDSNVDWGQDLRQLRTCLYRLGDPHPFVSYMGADNLLAYFLEDEIRWIEPPFSQTGKRTRIFQPSPGIYAISANLISGQFFEMPYRDFYRVFREAKPIAYAGYSIYIYRFP